MWVRMTCAGPCASIRAIPRTCSPSAVCGTAASRILLPHHTHPHPHSPTTPHPSTFPPSDRLESLQACPHPLRSSHLACDLLADISTPQPPAHTHLVISLRISRQAHASHLTFWASAGWCNLMGQGGGGGMVRRLRLIGGVEDGGHERGGEGWKLKGLPIHQRRR